MTTQEQSPVDVRPAIAPDAQPPAGSAPPLSTAHGATVSDTVAAVTGALPALVTVTAVVVTRGRTPYLPETLAAVRAQTSPPDDVVVVDVGTSPSTRDHRGLHLDDARFVPAPHARSVGQAVDAALADAGPPTWLWILHDDSAPETEALARLVDAVEHSSATAVAGPKQRGWDDPDVLLEVGFTVSPLGRRLTGIDLGEIDQGQHDARVDVLAVGLAGALVRTEVWTAVGGTDPELGPFGDGQDLCRRVRLAGHRVVVVPGAVVRHAQAGLRGLRGTGTGAGAVQDAAAPAAASGGAAAGGRPGPDAPGAGESHEPGTAGPSTAGPSTAGPSTTGPSTSEPSAAEPSSAGPSTSEPSTADQRPAPSEDGPDEPPTGDVAASFRARRRSQLHLRFVSVRAVMLPFAVLAAILWAPVRAMYQLAQKQPGWAADELLATVVAVGRVRAVARARRSARRTSTVRRAALAPLSGTWREVLVDRHDRRLARAERYRTHRAPTQIERRELRDLAVRRRATLGVVLVVLLGLTAWVFGPFLGVLGEGGRLVGGSLLSADGGIGDVWRAATSGHVEAGLGARGPADPWLVVLLPFTVLAGGSLQVAVDALLVGAFVVAGWGAWCAAGSVTRSPALRAWAAVLWVALPPLHEGVAAGRLPAVVAHAALPWVVLGVVRAVGAQSVDRVVAVVPRREDDADEPVRPDRPAPSLGAAAAGGLALAVAVAAEPVLLLPSALLLGVVALLVRQGRRSLVLVILPSLVVAAPYLVHAASTWPDGLRLLVAEPSLGGAAPSAAPWQMLLGWAAVPTPWFAATDGTLGTVAAWAPYALGGLLVVLALVSLVRPRRARATRFAWAVVLVGLVTAVVTAASDAAVAGIASATPGISLLLLGLVGASLFALRRHHDGAPPPRRAALRHEGRSRARRTGAALAAGALVLVCVVVPVGAVWSWVDDATSAGQVGELVATDADVVPPVGAQMQAPPRLATVLALDPSDGELGYALLHGDGSQLLESSVVVRDRLLTAPTDARTGADAVVAALAAGGSDDVAAELADLGVGGVLLPAGDDSAARTALVARLDTVPGLERATEGRSAVVWRVARANSDVEVSWATLADGAGTALASLPAADRAVDADVPAGADGRGVLLAETADPRWVATLDGRELTPVTTDGRQGFALGPDGGRLEIAYAWPWRLPWIVGGGLVLLVLVLLALPVGRRRGGRR
ncbi:GT2 family glycosyltransferase [Sediminihabitans luteus]|uniref:GT2 family glycosyltransferase n=1 Tax=Sediminihabitans luteus TaxID=1138585 RepID=A0A2M9CDH4_9CELL|nr:glycosyltransferase [Sediminihabitans luteus]PJJ69984.1 GT2 family glycosyltransferase [Sediminihabitans luteus]GII99305.1 hypothetical protein Slu03_16830 [Sediminihabitans luteus]